MAEQRKDHEPTRAEGDWSGPKRGRLPGRQTEQANAGADFPAERALKRAKEVPQSIRERIDETGLKRRTPGLRETGDLRAPLGDDQDSRGRGTVQEKDVHQRKGKDA